MTNLDKQKLKNSLQILANISYTSLIEIRQIKSVNQSEIEELEGFKKTLENLISELFEE